MVSTSPSYQNMRISREIFSMFFLWIFAKIVDVDSSTDVFLPPCSNKYHGSVDFFWRMSSSGFRSEKVECMQEVLPVKICASLETFFQRFSRVLATENWGSWYLAKRFFAHHSNKNCGCVVIFLLSGWMRKLLININNVAVNTIKFTLHAFFLLIFKDFDFSLGNTRTENYVIGAYC